MTADDRREAATALAAGGVTDVSRETRDQLVRLVELLREWQKAQNLVGPSALAEIWTRHVADSAQLVAIAPTAKRWIDIGSGSGFPGLVVAALLAEQSGASVELIESNARKCAFLREAARVVGLPVTVHRGRIEDVLPALDPPDAVSARALGSMVQLVAWLEPLLQRGVPAYLHKGLDFEREWLAIADPERFDLVLHPSRIGPGVIVELRAAAPGIRLET